MRVLSVEISDNKFAILHFVKAGEVTTTSLAYTEKERAALLLKLGELLESNVPVVVPDKAPSRLRRLLRRR